MLGQAASAADYPFLFQEAPGIKELDRSTIEEARGTIQTFDPVGHEISMLTRDGTQTFRLARDATIRVNKQEADSRSLRQGQGASLRLARERERDSRVAVMVQATERLELQAINGVIEFVDVELRLITLSHDGGFQTFELDPETTKIRVEGEVVSPDRLRKGQKASIRYVPTVKAIGFRDPIPDGAD